METVLSNFLYSMKSILGFESVSENVSDFAEVLKLTIFKARISVNSVNEFELDRVMRYRFVENVMRTRETLGSLFSIVEKMRNMKIEDEIVVMVPNFR